MAAANTDLFSKVSRKWVGQIGAGGVADASVTTIPLSSSTNLATDTGVIAVIDRVNANGVKTPTLEETIIGVVSGDNLVTSTRGVEGTAQAHSAGAVVEILITAKGWNNVVDGVLVGHTQLGAHKASLPLTTPQITTSINDSGGNELFKVTATASAVNEFTVANAATGSNPVFSITGGDTNIGMDLKMKGTGKFRKPVVVHIPAVGATSDTSTGDGKAFFEVPEEMNGMNITAAGAYVYTAGTTNTTDVQLRNVTQAADILSTKITIDTTEVSSRTAATPAVVNASEDDLTTGDRIAVDIDAVSTTAAKGLVAWFRAELP